MKAFLLAAGKGERLSPITHTIPKCLVPIRGIPLMEYWFDLFEKHRITEILINLHHLADKVFDYLNERKVTLEKKNLRVTTTYEGELLGSAGTIRANGAFITPGEDFFICYADNLTNVDLSDLLAFHRTHTYPLTLGLFPADAPRHCGIAVLDAQGSVVDFQEKPQNPKSNLANAGIYVARDTLFEFLPESVPADIGYDLLPRLVGRMKGYRIRGKLQDIGTMQSYLKAGGNT